jgi:O-antigen biosynthesis protein WbqP
MTTNVMCSTIAPMDIEFDQKKDYQFVKRVIGLFLSLISLIVLFPLLLIISLLIKIDSKGPVFFKQKRIGIHLTNFYVFKFRTMQTDAPKDTPTHLLANPDLYITKLGAFLRKTSIDELPQLINIIKGEMAIVGPRPALWNQDDLVAERAKYGANYVPPGLTGWAQVNGRDDLPIPLKAKLDGEYVRRRSLSFDLKCILLTVSAVLRRDGIKEGQDV